MRNGTADAESIYKALLPGDDAAYSKMEVEIKHYFNQVTTTITTHHLAFSYDNTTIYSLKLLILCIELRFRL